MTGRLHLHRVDHPATLGLLAELAHGRTLDGYDPTDAGAYVDWAALAEHLSTPEVAVVLIAQACATLERATAALPPELRAAVLQAVRDVLGSD